MIFTVVQAHVPHNKQEKLKAVFKEQLGKIPPDIRQALLVQSTSDPTLWQTIGFWPSRKALDDYLGSVKVPGGKQIFLALGIDPSLTVFEIVDQHHELA